MAADLQLIFGTIGVSQMISDLTRLEGKAMSLGSVFTSVTQSLSGPAGIAAIGTIIGDVAIKAGKAAVEYETLSTQFSVFLGSAEKATQVLADLNKFSIETPFTPDEVNKAGRSLLAFGVATENLIPTLKAVGDVSSAVGKDFNELAQIYGKAKTANQLFAEDINQLTGAGIPIIEELAKVMGVGADQVKKLGSQGKIHFAELEKAFQNMTSEGGRFSGMMDKMSQTTAGLISTIEGKLQDELRNIGLAMLPTIKTIVEGMEPAMNSLKDAIVTIYTPMVDAFSAIGDLVSIFNIGGTSGNKFANIVGTIASILKITTLPAQLLWKAIGAIVTGFKNLIEFGGRVIEKIGSIGSAFDLVLAPIKAVSAVWDELFGDAQEKAGLSAQSIGYWNHAVSEMAKKTGATTLEMNRFIEGFDKSTIAGLSATEASKVVTRQLLKFIEANREAANSAGGIVEPTKAAGDNAKYAAGSIGFLEEKLRALQEAYRGATTDIARFNLQGQIKEVGREIERLTGVTHPAAGSLSGVLKNSMLSAAAAAKQTKDAIDELSEVIEMSDSAPAPAFIADTNVKIAEMMTLTDRLRLKFHNLFDGLPVDKINAAFEHLKDGARQIGDAFKQFAVDAAFAFGEAIAGSGKFGQSMAQLLTGLGATISKLAGMALLNASISLGPTPAALGMALAGLGLIGLSGAIGAIGRRNQQSTSGPNLATPNSGMNTPSRSGIGEGGRSAFEGMELQLVMQDGTAMPAYIRRAGMREGRRRG